MISLHIPKMVKAIQKKLEKDLQFMLIKILRKINDSFYIFSFNNRVYLGPNENGTGGIHFEPDGSNPVNFSFGLHQDPTGISLNSAYGVTPSQLFPSFGRSGCTANSAGCGSNNQGQYWEWSIFLVAPIILGVT